MYWYSREIEDLLSMCIRARLRCIRAGRPLRKGWDDGVELAQLHQGYRDARKAMRLAMRLAIKGAKTQAWDELHS